MEVDPQAQEEASKPTSFKASKTTSFKKQADGAADKTTFRFEIVSAGDDARKAAQAPAVPALTRPKSCQTRRASRCSSTLEKNAANILPCVASSEAEDKSKRSIDAILRDVMRAYMNLELSGVRDAEVPKLAEALRSNNSVTSVNLSFCNEILDTGIAILGAALRENMTARAYLLHIC